MMTTEKASNKVSLTLAFDHYDRHVPFLDKSVTIDEIELHPMVVGQSNPGTYGKHRHQRMLKEQEFDFAELSFSSYLMARDQGLPFIAIPVFPRRLFTPSQMYINKNSGIQSPSDLRGKRVGINSFQKTFSVLAKGDLQHFYGVKLHEIDWVTDNEETIPFNLSSGIRLSAAPKGTTIGELLAAGKIDALMDSRIPKAFLQGDPNVLRLFSNPQAEEERYYKERGYYPIMHVVAVRQDVAGRYPFAVKAVYDAFERARITARERYNDPNWSILAWGRKALEHEWGIFGRDPWENGVNANRRNIEQFVQYSFEQGLLKRRLTFEDLFHQSTLNT